MTIAFEFSDDVQNIDGAAKEAVERVRELGQAVSFSFNGIDVPVNLDDTEARVVFRYRIKCSANVQEDDRRREYIGGISFGMLQKTNAVEHRHDFVEEMRAANFTVPDADIPVEQLIESYRRY